MIFPPPPRFALVGLNRYQGASQLALSNYFRDWEERKLNCVVEICLEIACWKTILIKEVASNWRAVSEAQCFPLHSSGFRKRASFSCSWSTGYVYFHVKTLSEVQKVSFKYSGDEGWGQECPARERACNSLTPSCSSPVNQAKASAEKRYLLLCPFVK